MDANQPSKEVQLQINLEPLRKRSLLICTPAYGGNMNACYVRSLLEAQKLLMSYGIPHSIQFMYNESLISRARNHFADTFLHSEHTDLMFIDSDIEFNAQDIILLMHFNKDLIGGAYPLKGIDWERIKSAIIKNPSLPAEDLAKHGNLWSSHPFKGDVLLTPYEPLAVQELATGFMMISKKVFETLKPASPSYSPCENELKKGHSTEISDFFEVSVHNSRYESEDYSFCRKWRESGGEVFLCPWMKLTHYGTYPFVGDMFLEAETLGTLQ